MCKTVIGKKSRVLAVIFAIILLTVGPGHGIAAPADVEKVSLTRGAAIEMALRKNIDLKVETLGSSMAGTDVARSRSIYDPIFSVSAGGGVSAVTGEPFFLTRSSTSSIGLTQNLSTGGSIGVSTQAGFTTANAGSTGPSTTDWQSSAGLTLTQPILKNAGRKTTELSITLASNTLRDSHERLRFIVTDTALAVITSYNHLYALRETLESRRAALNSAQAFLNELNKKTGPLQRMDIANAEFSTAQRRKDLVDAERNVRDQEAGLRYLIGMESKAQLIPVDPPSRNEPQETEEQAVKAALAFRTDLKQLRLALTTSELQEQVARHQTLPELTLTGSGGISGTGPNLDNSFRQLGNHPAHFWSAGMQFSVPLGNTAAKNDFRKSKIRTRQVQTQIEALAWKIQNEVEADMRALISARLQLQMTDRSREFAELRLDEYRKNNRLGTATVQDVINAENDQTTARNAQMDATEAFSNAVAKLWRDTGVLLERLDVPVAITQPAGP
ncbi:MAG TPA: TolC family protein [Candidatus Deferrimicrobiaceae bacterium]|jgi:outer membrane protein TolC